MSLQDFVARHSSLTENAGIIDEALYQQYDVKRGLRNKDHTGVLVGLTNVGSVLGYEKQGDQVVAIPVS